VVRAVTGEIFVPEHLILPQGGVPLCEDSSLRAAVLATLPTLNDGGLAPRQMGGDHNRGIQIPGAAADLAQTGATRSDPSAKGKQAVVGSSAPSGPSPGQSSSGTPPVEVSWRRLHCSDMTLVTEPAAKRQRAIEDAGQGSSRAPAHAGPLV